MFTIKDEKGKILWFYSASVKLYKLTRLAYTITWLEWLCLVVIFLL